MMKTEDIETLKKVAEQAAFTFSQKDRPKNYSGEDFHVEKIIPLSEMTAAAIFNKSSGLRTIAFFYLILLGEQKDPDEQEPESDQRTKAQRRDRRSWYYFFPTDSHLLGMRYLEDLKKWIERENFKTRK